MKTFPQSGQVKVFPVFPFRGLLLLGGVVVTVVTSPGGEFGSSLPLGEIIVVGPWELLVGLSSWVWELPVGFGEMGDCKAFSLERLEVGEFSGSRTKINK